MAIEHNLDFVDRKNVEECIVHVARKGFHVVGERGTHYLRQSSGDS